MSDSKSTTIQEQQELRSRQCWFSGNEVYQLYRASRFDGTLQLTSALCQMPAPSIRIGNAKYKHVLSRRIGRYPRQSGQARGPLQRLGVGLRPHLTTISRAARPPASDSFTASMSTFLPRQPHLAPSTLKRRLQIHITAHDLAKFLHRQQALPPEIEAFRAFTNLPQRLSNQDHTSSATRTSPPNPTLSDTPQDVRTQLQVQRQDDLRGLLRRRRASPQETRW